MGPSHQGRWLDSDRSWIPIASGAESSLVALPANYLPFHLALHPDVPWKTGWLRASLVRMTGEQKNLSESLEESLAVWTMAWIVRQRRSANLNLDR